jgi:hypothetical protein
MLRKIVLGFVMDLLKKMSAAHVMVMEFQRENVIVTVM